MTAIGTEAMPPVPVEQRLGLAGNRGVARRQHKGGGAHLAECPFAEMRFAGGVKIKSEQRLSALQSEKYAQTCLPLHTPTEKRGFVCTHQWAVLPKWQEKTGGFLRREPS